MDNDKNNDHRIIDSIKFSVGVFSIIYGIFLFLMIFSQFYRHLGLANGNYSGTDQIMKSSIHPEIFYPVIFIPEAIILLTLGLNLLVILRQQLLMNKNRKLDYLSLSLIVCIILFTLLFLIGHLIAHYYFGKYEILNPSFMLLIAVTITCISFYILYYVFKVIDYQTRTIKGNKKRSKKLFNNSNYDNKVITTFFITIIVILLLMKPIIDSNTPSTNTKIFLEDGRKITLPGINTSYNLTIESKGGCVIYKYIIKELYKEGIWNVSSREIIVKPNERKTITFTNHILPNATESWNEYGFYLIFISDFGGEGLRGILEFKTEITQNINYYINAQKSSQTSLPLLLDGESQSSFNRILLDLASLIFIAWIVITIIFQMKKIGNKRNKSSI